MNDLMMCPFCGRQPENIRVSIEDGHVVSRIECTYSGCPVKPSTMSTTNGHLEFTGEIVSNSIRTVKEYWNRRSGDSK